MLVLPYISMTELFGHTHMDTIAEADDMDISEAAETGARPRAEEDQIKEADAARPRAKEDQIKEADADNLETSSPESESGGAFEEDQGPTSFGEVSEDDMGLASAGTSGVGTSRDKSD